VGYIIPTASTSPQKNHPSTIPKYLRHAYQRQVHLEKTDLEAVSRSLGREVQGPKHPKHSVEGDHSFFF